MAKKNKQPFWCDKVFFIVFFFITIATLLISDKIIKWNTVLNTTYQLDVPYRILISFLYTTVFLVVSFLLAYFGKLKVIYLQIIAFIIGITMTLFWIPLYQKITSNNSEDKDTYLLLWTWYKYDIIAVFMLYLFIFGLVKYLATYQNIIKLKQIFNKNKHTLK